MDDLENCFYSTYEELKLRYAVFQHHSCIEGFYSTYEELKLEGSITKRKDGRWRFYSTYEELKPAVEVASVAVSCVFLQYL